MSSASDSLPGFYAITPPLLAENHLGSILNQVACRQWLLGFQELLVSGVALVQLRAKALNFDHLETLAQHCHELSSRKGVRLLLNGPAELVESIGMAGVHLDSKSLSESQSRPLPCEYLVGASCHSPDELKRAETIGADFACLSPVKPVSAYKCDKQLGIDTFRQWVSDCKLPVYGLGGLGKPNLEEIVEAGGQGVAGISAFWRG